MADTPLAADAGSYALTGGDASLSPFIPGKTIIGTITGTTAATATATAAVGGSLPIAYRWQTSTDGAVTWANAAGTGTTTLSASLTGLDLTTRTLVRVRYTDAATPALVAYSAVRSISLRRGALRWFRQLGMPR